MAQAIPHHSDCNPNRRRDSGTSENSTSFHQKYNINVPFRLDCLGCCFSYLIGRNYTVSPTRSFDRVCFSSDDLGAPGVIISGDLVSSFVRVPRSSGRQGQIATNPDPNLGYMSVRPFEDSRTYQLYSSENRALSVGFPARARMESVAIEVVRPDELGKIYLNYADAALVELYRENQNLPPLGTPDITGYLLLR